MSSFYKKKLISNRNNGKKGLRKIDFKPFYDSLSGHTDSILKIIPHPIKSSFVFTCSSDGELRFWSLCLRKNIKTIKAHDRAIKDASISPCGKILITCSDDRYLKMWDLSEAKSKPIYSFVSKSPFSSVCYHTKGNFFLTGNDDLILWDCVKFKPVQKLGWRLSSISSIKINKKEFNVIGTTCSDRSIVLFDLRIHSPIKKFFMDFRSNDILWSKRNNYDFFLGNDDGNIHQFDMRRLGHVKKTYRGHLMPVTSMDEDYKNSKIISGSLDNTIMISCVNNTNDKYVYHSQRMKRILCISIAMDNEFIISGSEDGNLRIWKNFYYKSKIKKDDLNCSNRETINNTFAPRNLKNMLRLKEILFQKKRRKVLNTRYHSLPGIKGDGV